MQIATNLKDKFLRLGLSFKSVDKQTVTVETLPTFLVDKSAKEVSFWLNFEYLCCEKFLDKYSYVQFFFFFRKKTKRKPVSLD